MTFNDHDAKLLPCYRFCMVTECEWVSPAGCPLPAGSAEIFRAADCRDAVRAARAWIGAHPSTERWQHVKADHRQDAASRQPE